MYKKYSSHVVVDEIVNGKTVRREIMFKDHLKSLQNVKVQGYLHKAPHRSFRLPFMITADTQSPYVRSEVDKNAIPVDVCLAYPDQESDKINLVLTDGAIFPTYGKFNKDGWLKDVYVSIEERSEEEDISWFVHDLLLKAGRL